MNTIDLRSDTLTQPSPAMRAAMADAEVGDDVYGEDPTVNTLEGFAADLLGKEAALYMTTGTQANLVALLTHCGRGDEYIVGQPAHNYRLEGGGAAALGGIQPQPLEVNENGEMSVAAIAEAIKPDDFHFARTRVVGLENTHNGTALDNAYIGRVHTLCQTRDLALHLDGARFFNAAVESGVTPAQLADPFDSISICLSKGLGAPVGSLLVGSSEFVAAARRWRKVVGGGMRQAGIVAAAGLYALKNNIDRMRQDHTHAEMVAAALRARYGDQAVKQATNMVHLDIDPGAYTQLRNHLADANIRVGRPRWVFHLDIHRDHVERLVEQIQALG